MKTLSLEEIEEKYVRYMCPYGHVHSTNEECFPCVELFDKECEWNDPKDPIFLALPGKGDGF